MPRIPTFCATANIAKKHRGQFPPQSRIHIVEYKSSSYYCFDPATNQTVLQYISETLKELHRLSIFNIDLRQSLIHPFYSQTFTDLQPLFRIQHHIPHLKRQKVLLTRTRLGWLQACAQCAPASHSSKGMIGSFFHSERGLIVNL